MCFAHKLSGAGSTASSLTPSLTLCLQHGAVPHPVRHGVGDVRRPGQGGPHGARLAGVAGRQGPMGALSESHQRDDSHQEWQVSESISSITPYKTDRSETEG